MSDDSDAMLRALQALERQFDGRYDRLEERLEQFEKQLSILIQGYAELAAIVESIFSLFINKDEDQKKEFFEALSLARKTMMESLQHGIKIGEDNSDKFIAHSTGANEQFTGDQVNDDK